ncbi:MAG: hypothetical protein H0V20_04500 [Actinobacteria bacterium]|nr:hypothetical protein [Actinomycetota bacterium]
MSSLNDDEIQTRRLSEDKPRSIASDDDQDDQDTDADDADSDSDSDDADA